jgi:hypothetical protein
MAGAVLLVSLPYLLFLSRSYTVGRAPRRPFGIAGLLELVLQAPRTMTPWRLGGWTELETWAGPVSRAVGVVSVLFVAACAAATVAGLVLALRSDDPRARRMGRAAVVAWAGTVLLLAAAGLDLHPHYHFSATWVPVFGVAFLAASMRRTRPRAWALALTVLAIVAVVQFAVVVLWMAYVRERGGTRTPSYGTPLGAQVEVLRQACAGPETRIVLVNDTAMFRFPFEYLATTEEACRGKAVVVCAREPGPAARACPPPEPGARRVRMGYAHAVGGALRVE